MRRTPRLRSLVREAPRPSRGSAPQSSARGRRSPFFVASIGPAMRVLLVSANREMLPSPVVPIGPLAVAAALREDHDVKLLDLCFEQDPGAAIERAAEDFDPEI